MFKDYINKRKSFLFLYLVLSTLTLLVLKLGDTLNDYIIYLFMIYSLVLCLFVCLDYYFYRKKRKELRLLENSLETIIQEFPKDQYLCEKQYQDIVQLLQDDLFQHQSLSKKSYHEMLDYYTMWVHQIKTPISALKLLIQTTGTQQEMLLELRKIEQYVDMVLQYLRLGTIHNDLSFHELSLKDLVNETVKKQSLFFIQQKLSITINIDDTVILTDEKWISFVLEQLLSNALKYTKTGGITIYNEGEKLYIKDTGIGISPEDLPRVFDKGFTGQIGRVDKKASGLGLYLVKTILDELQHPITIQSTLNKGTTLQIDFYKKRLIVE